MIRCITLSIMHVCFKITNRYVHGCRMAYSLCILCPATFLLTTFEGISPSPLVLHSLYYKNRILNHVISHFVVLLSLSSGTDGWINLALSVLSQNPIWLSQSEVHYTRMISALSRSDLLEGVRMLSTTGKVSQSQKSELIGIVLCDFAQERTSLLDSDLSHLDVTIERSSLHGISIGAMALL